ncbi:enoyl-CoA hydratase-related protein [Pseudomonas fluorescens]|nr:enoyl-CoA hydratase-related protein [Pseudomonas fluorescens]
MTREAGRMGGSVHKGFSNGVATLTLNCPDTGNALSVALADDLAAKARDVADDASVRCVLLTGTGRFFCVGGDVRAMYRAGDSIGPLVEQMTSPLHCAISTFLRMDKPLVIAVNGPAAGGGLGLAVMGDIVLASASAHFSMAYTGIGFSPDGAATWLLPRLIGLRRTQELALLNRRLSSEEAASLGLITRVVPADQLDSQCRVIAETLARGPNRAFSTIRRLLQSSGALGVEAQMSAEALGVRMQAESAEGREGVAAFVTKRAPDFLSQA